MARERPTESQRLVAEVESNLRQFMYMDEHYYTMLSLWIPHTHLWSITDSGFKFIPQRTGRVYFGSNLAGCGKSQAMELTTIMSANGEVHINPTSYGLIAAINEGLGTNGVDEIDRFFGATGGKAADCQTILLAGYKSGSYFTRQRNNQALKLNIHGPAVLAGKNLNAFKTAEHFDTMRTRSFVVELGRKPKHATVDRYKSVVHEPRLRATSARLNSWGKRNARTICAINVEHILAGIGLDNRDEEIWTVLFQLAQFIGGDWPARVEKAARHMVLGEHDEDAMPEQSPYDEAIAMARLAFGDDDTFLPTRVVIQRMMTNPLCEGMWFMREWRTPQGATMGLANVMRANGVPTTERGYYNGKQERGYHRSDLLVDSLDSDDVDSPERESVDAWDWSGIE